MSNNKESLKKSLGITDYPWSSGMYLPSVCYIIAFLAFSENQSSIKEFPKRLRSVKEAQYALLICIEGKTQVTYDT